MSYRIIIFILLGLWLASCNDQENRLQNIDLSGTEKPEVKIKRYEKALFLIPPDSLKPELKKIAPEFPVFLNADLDDTLNIIQLHEFITDPLNVMLYDSVMAKYPDMSLYEEAFSDAFRRFKYFFPEEPLPDIFTYVSGLLYEKPVQFFNDDLIIAMDMYLGENLEEYRKLRLPLYQIKKMNASFIVRDGMYEMYYYHFLEKPGKDFLQLMVNKGKHLYFLDACLPDVPDHIKIGYPEKKLDWCRKNESNIWAFIIENDLLYTSDAYTIRKFFADGPFTSDFSSDSPARMGEWIGWQIIRAYMNNNTQTTLEELLELSDAQIILKNSGYKPH